MNRRRLKILLACVLGAVGIPASAGKIEDVITSVKTECGKDITKEEALRIVKGLYVTCVPGGTVEVGGGCQLKCKRQSGGGVIGK